MELDVEGHLGAVERSVSSVERGGQSARAVTLARGFPTTVEDLWDAVTNGERIARWFLPIGGDLVLGGRYQLQGNASGTVKACQRPSYLAVTWEFAGNVSWVAVRLSDDDGRSRLALTHIAFLSEHWSEYGPGAVGVGWELGLLGLASHVAQPSAQKLDEANFVASPDGKAFVAGSSDGWRRAAIANGADPHAARAAANRTTTFYTDDSAAPA